MQFHLFYTTFYFHWKISNRFHPLAFPIELKQNESLANKMTYFITTLRRSFPLRTAMAVRLKCSKTSSFVERKTLGENRDDRENIWKIYIFGAANKIEVKLSSLQRRCFSTFWRMNPFYLYPGTGKFLENLIFLELFPNKGNEIEWPEGEI